MPIYGPFILDVLAGAGALCIGIGALVAGLALAKTLGRVNVTLEGVDRQLDEVGPSVASMLTHVNGITSSLEETTTRLGDAAKSVEQTAALAKNAASPAIVNAGAALTGITAGLRRLVTGKNSTDQS